MKCLGRTRSRSRCKRDVDKIWPFCASHSWQPLVFMFTSLTLIGLLAGLYQDLYKEIFPPATQKEKQLHLFTDRYLTVEIMSAFNGPFYNCQGYRFWAEIKNNQDIILFIPEVKALFFSQRVIEEVKAYRDIYNRDDNLYYVSICEIRGVLAPQKSNKLYFRGPQFLPEVIELVVSHSGSKMATRHHFRIDNNEKHESLYPKQVYMPEPEDMGIDGFDAIQKAAPIIKKFSNPQIVSCLPSKHTSFIQPNGLYRHEINEWALVYRVGIPEEKIELGDGILIISKDDIKNVSNFELDDTKVKHLFELDQVRIRTMEALKIANDLNLIHGNSPHGWALLAGKIYNGEEIPIWRLPYIGSDYLNIFIDAEKGTVLPSMSLYKELAPLETSSTTRMKKGENSGGESKNRGS